MTRETIAQKADRLLIERRVIVTNAGPGSVTATVRGEGAIYTASYASGAWSCTCPASTSVARCSHVAALKAVSAPDFDEPDR